MRAVAAGARARRSSATSIYRDASSAVYGALRAVPMSGWSRRLVARSAAVFTVTLLLVGASVYALSRIPTSFLPVEDQGYMLVSVQLPDGASLSRTTAALDEVTRRARAVPGVDKVIAIAGLSALDGNCQPRQCRRRLCHADRLEGAQQQGEDLLGLDRRAQPGGWLGSRRTGPALVAAAAADPGHRQRRRASPCRSSCATAASTMPSSSAIGDADRRAGPRAERRFQAACNTVQRPGAAGRNWRSTAPRPRRSGHLVRRRR